LAIKNGREKTSRLDIKDLEEAEKLKVKLQIKEIKETPSNGENLILRVLSSNRYTFRSNRT